MPVLSKPIRKAKTCKLCDKKRYGNQSLCFSHYHEKSREKKLAKKEKHESTKIFKEKLSKKLIRENDRLFQELCRSLFDKCYFGHEYSCGHHWIRKSQSLYTRYDINNIIPVCMECHCEIHQGQNSVLEAKFVLDKGGEWYREMTSKKKIVVTDKLAFLQLTNKSLKLSLDK